MTPTDRCWIDPDPEEVTAALREMAEFLEGVYPTARFLQPMAFDRDYVVEGQQTWLMEESNPDIRERAVIRLVWWRDFLQRLHVRLWICGISSADAAGETRKWEAGPALLQVYPLAGFQRTDAGGNEPVLICPCGVMGSAEAIGWMGTECGPCHDRRTAGELPSQHWGIFARRLKIPSNGDDPPGLHFTPDDRVLIQGTQSVLWNPRTSKESRFRHPQGHPLAWASTGAVLLALEEQIQPEDAWLWLQPAGSEPGRALRAPPPPADGIRFSPTGRYLSLRAPHLLPTLFLWDLHRPEAEPFCQIREAACWDFTPDSTQVFIADSAGYIHERRLPEGDVEQTLLLNPLARGNLKIPHGLRVLPDGNLLVLTHPPALWLLDSITGEELARCDLPDVEVRTEGLAVDPSGRMAVVTSRRGPLLTLVDLSRFQVVARLSIPDWPESAEMIANDRRLVLANRFHARIVPWPPLVEWFLREVGR